jgi:hypothetical protein
MNICYKSGKSENEKEHKIGETDKMIPFWAGD